MTSSINQTDEFNAKHLAFYFMTGGVLIGLIIGAIILTYWGPLNADKQNQESYPFLLDDFTSIVQNKRIQNPNWELKPKGNLVHWWMGRPLTTHTFAIDFQKYKGLPHGYRLFNIKVHAFNSALLFILLWRVLILMRIQSARSEQRVTDMIWSQEKRFHWTEPTLAFLITLCWAIHPLCTQAVTYVVQRGEALAATGVFIAGICLAFAFYPGRTNQLRAILLIAFSLIACLIGIGFKPVAVMFPAIAGVIFLSSQRAPIKRLRQYWLPITIAGLLFIGLLLFLLYEMNLFESAKPNTKGLSAGFGAKMDPVMYILAQPRVILQYLSLTLYPHTQSLDYGWKSLSFGMKEAIGFMGLTCCLVIAILGWFKSRFRWLSTVFFCALIYLAPTSLIPVWDICVEHRMYLPSALLIFMGVGMLHAAVSHISLKRPFKIGFTIILITLFAITMGMFTFLRNLDYKTNISLWESSLHTWNEKPRTNSRGWNNLGRLYSIRAQKFKQLMVTQAKRHPDQLHQFESGFDHYMAKAETAYRRSITYLNEDWPIDQRVAPVARTNLGLTLLVQERIGECIELLSETVNRWPEHADAHITLAKAYTFDKQLEIAETHFMQGLKLAEHDSIKQYEVGQFYIHTKRYEKAASYLEKAVAFNPNQTMFKIKLVDAYMKSGQVKKAAAYLEMEVKRYPDNKPLRGYLDKVKKMINQQS